MQDDGPADGAAILGRRSGKFESAANLNAPTAQAGLQRMPPPARNDTKLDEVPATD
jgi:hypothetical protein